MNKNRIYFAILAYLFLPFFANAQDIIVPYAPPPETPSTYGKSKTYKPPEHHIEMEKLARDFGYAGGAFDGKRKAALFGS